MSKKSVSIGNLKTDELISALHKHFDVSERRTFEIVEKARIHFQGASKPFYYLFDEGDWEVGLLEQGRDVWSVSGTLYPPGA